MPTSDKRKNQVDSKYGKEIQDYNNCILKHADLGQSIGSVLVTGNQHFQFSQRQPKRFLRTIWVPKTEKALPRLLLIKKLHLFHPKIHKDGHAKQADDGQTCIKTA